MNIEQTVAGKAGASSLLWGQHWFRTNQVSRADRDTTQRELGGVTGVLRADDVDEMAISPSKCNKSKNGQ